MLDAGNNQRDYHITPVDPGMGGPASCSPTEQIWGCEKQSALDMGASYHLNLNFWSVFCTKMDNSLSAALQGASEGFAAPNFHQRVCLWTLLLPLSVK